MRSSRRHWLSCGVFGTAITSMCLCLAITNSQACGEDATPPPKVDEAVDHGLAFLARQQNTDGSIDGGGPRVAMTGLSIMAMLASGHTPDVGRYGLTVRRAIDFELRQMPEDGYIGKIDGSRMYGQGIVTLALAESIGVETTEAGRQRIRAALDRAVKVILSAQDVPKDAASAGGWRYEPTSVDSDLSLSAWNALALRAAANVGVDVPHAHVERAAAYVLKCYRADQGGFAYQPALDATEAMTGVGVLSLYLLGASERPEVSAAAPLLARQLVNDKTRYPCYATYYASRAAFQAGDPVWSTVWQGTMDRLLAQQLQSDGGWPVSHTTEEPGRVYATAMAVLTLSTPYRLLPVDQK
jgi:hypothetical protein